MKGIVIGFSFGAGIPLMFGADCIASGLLALDYQRAQPRVTTCGLTGVWNALVLFAGWAAILCTPLLGGVGALAGFIVESVFAHRSKPQFGLAGIRSRSLALPDLNRIQSNAGGERAE